MLRESARQPTRLTIAFKGGPEYIAGRPEWDDRDSS
jgi:hypothetical protein